MPMGSATPWLCVKSLIHQPNRPLFFSPACSFQLPRNQIKYYISPLPSHFPPQIPLLPLPLSSGSFPLSLDFFSISCFSAVFVQKWRPSWFLLLPLLVLLLVCPNSRDPLALSSAMVGRIRDFRPWVPVCLMGASVLFEPLWHPLGILLPTLFLLLLLRFLLFFLSVPFGDFCFSANWFWTERSCFCLISLPSLKLIVSDRCCTHNALYLFLDGNFLKFGSIFHVLM